MFGRFSGPFDGAFNGLHGQRAHHDWAYSSKASDGGNTTGERASPNSCGFADRQRRQCFFCRCFSCYFTGQDCWSRQGKGDHCCCLERMLNNKILYFFVGTADIVKKITHYVTFSIYIAV